MAWRLNIYFAKLLVLCFLAVLSIIGLASFLVTLSETFDRNFAHLTPSNTELIMLAAYNTPDHLQKVMPLIILLAAMVFFLHLARTQQLLMAQQAGIALTRLLVISIVVVLSLGTATITLLNPLAATLLERFDTFINRHIDGSESLLSVADTGIWLRQALKDSVLVIHARSLSPDKLSFEDVSVFEYRNSIFHRRIEARRALIKGNHWNMQDVLVYTVGGYTEKHPTHQLVTNINQDTIRDSFTSVSAVSIWKLHDFISAVENVGFDAKEHVTHFHRLLSTPVVMLAMFLLSGGICARAHHRKLPHLLILSTIGIGFGYFVFLTTFQSLGLFYEWPILLTIWLPHLLFLVLVSTYILHQDSPNH